MQPLSELLFTSRYIKDDESFDKFVGILRIEYLKRKQERRPPLFCQILAEAQEAKPSRIKVKNRKNRNATLAVSYKYPD
ncbi:MAG: hypothetical protein A3C58_03410 [Candidatus Staskawiczbacteria bacterium RIFCSPHIGHO2_02_FULL_34_10]|uniref:Uncharacterized protein n=2 Tax=Candidatus Staskawicziibacteriota TaxID=1817916 RepID=A0A1G2HLB9_9BACT|nr:MAG: hypothetical protein A2639_02305 [Candidatus Staskawiczbacteria bacterium RIFCSPHIGHO2_01_FULL_34_27]OGZ66103.1 MAG: hypothetical protein A3C58_03410 [Candidatus Staskawiczbacteria bacterium RIFCSPHIGHO2_02_FULL_34_10]